ncbi:MAG: AI-2E family transporter [Planctomycetes bacterium]|nr:AI-2E family transporter [Planctomycetota bacterium]
MTDPLREERMWLMAGALAVLAVVALGAALIYTQSVMIPFVLAVFLASLVSPLVDAQVLKLRFPHWLAVGVAMVVVLAVLGLAGMVFVLAVDAVAEGAYEYSASFAHLLSEGLEQLGRWGFNVREAEIEAQLRLRTIGVITRTAETILNLLTSVAIVLVFVVFLLVGRDPHAALSGVYAEIDVRIRRYLGTLFGLSLITGVLVGSLLAAFHLPMAWLFGLLTFLLNFIPSLGSVIATLLPIPIAVAEFETWPQVAAVILLPGAVQALIGYFLQPKLMGRGLELHPVTILLALAFWGLLWGLAGMVLAVPITATLRIVLVRFPITRPVGELLAGHLPGIVDHEAADDGVTG